jgi:hypothetical protein
MAKLIKRKYSVLYVGGFVDYSICRQLAGYVKAQSFHHIADNQFSYQSLKTDSPIEASIITIVPILFLATAISICINVVARQKYIAEKTNNKSED